MRKALKILIPNYPYPDSFAENVAYTVAGLGHQVQTMPKVVARHRNNVRRLFGDAWSAYFPGTWSSHERWVVRTAKAWSPDLVLAPTVSLKEEVLAELKRAGVAQCVAWWGDSPANLGRMGLLCDGWDLIYMKDAAAVAKFQALGLAAALLHEAMNPDWHKFFDGPKGADADSIIVAGSYYGYRQALVKALDKRGVSLALYGNQPPRWSNDSVRKNFRGRYIIRESKSRIFASGLACLNSTSLSEGNSLNCRAFEICGAGGLQLIEDKPVVQACFDPGREVLTYDSVEQILTHLDRARRDKPWARSIRKAGYRRAHSEHTYELRLKRILCDAGYSASRIAQ